MICVDFISLKRTAHSSATASTPIPTVRRLAENKERFPPEEELVLVVADETPNDFDLFDVIEWIDERGLLDEAYHISDANCQHFTSLLWSQLSKKPYPHPNEFNEPIPPMRRNGMAPALVEEDEGESS